MLHYVVLKLSTKIRGSAAVISREKQWIRSVVTHYIFQTLYTGNVKIFGHQNMLRTSELYIFSQGFSRGALHCPLRL